MEADESWIFESRFLDLADRGVDLVSDIFQFVHSGSPGYLVAHIDQYPCPIQVGDGCVKQFARDRCMSEALRSVAT